MAVRVDVRNLQDLPPVVAEQFLLEDAFYKKVKKQSGALIPGPSSARAALVQGRVHWPSGSVEPPPPLAQALPRRLAARPSGAANRAVERLCGPRPSSGAPPDIPCAWAQDGAVCLIYAG